MRKRWTPPKTDDSVRRVPVDEETIKIFKKLKNQQKFYIDNGTIKNPDNMLFIDINYGIITNKGINKHLKQVLKPMDT